MNLNKLRLLSAMVAIVAASGLVACGDDDPVDNGTVDPDTDAGMVDNGPPVDQGNNVVRVEGEITADTTWTSDTIYEINGLVFVTNNSTLTIEAGTQIFGIVRDSSQFCIDGDGNTTTTSCEGFDARGFEGEFDGEELEGQEGFCIDSLQDGDATCSLPAEEGSAIVVTRGSQMVANGTASEPIVMTSNNARAGSTEAPVPGDWGGLVLLGDDQLNVTGGVGNIEGIPDTDARGEYGSTAVSSGSCGDLNYVVVEYAGYIFGLNNELNSITLGGCGPGTQLSFVEAYRGLDDGIEFFGGQANLDHAIVVGTGDDSLDWDLGFRGNIQYFIAQQRDVPGEDRCIEADNLGSNFEAEPTSSPNLYNFTCIGARQDDLDRRGQDGARFREGTGGVIANSIWVNWDDQGIDIDGDVTAQRVTGMQPSGPGLSFEGVILHCANGANCPTDDRINVDDGFEGAITVAEMGIADVDPMFAASAWGASPSFVPGDATATTTDVADDVAGIENADYIGAVNPDGSDNWYEGWANFE